jgi:hypothetical protein
LNRPDPDLDPLVLFGDAVPLLARFNESFDIVDSLFVDSVASVVAVVLVSVKYNAFSSTLILEQN